MSDINYGALVLLIEENWYSFISLIGTPEEAEIELKRIKQKAGLYES